MIELLIWPIFLFGVVLNILSMRRMDIRRMDFMDGIIIGHLYFIIIPMIFFLVIGSTSMLVNKTSLMPDRLFFYKPFEDIATTATLLEGIYLMPLMRLLLPRSSLNATDETNKHLLGAMIALFVVTNAVSFVMTGMASGGHWQENLQSAFAANPLVVVLKQGANIARTAAFGLLLYKVDSGKMQQRTALIIGLVIVVMDLFMTFNRITGMYFLIMFLVMIRKNFLFMITVAISSLLALSSVSILWPMFRSFATQDGYTVDGMTRAWNIATTSAGDETAIDESLNSVFESSNLVVLNWVVDNAGSPQMPYLYGQMFVRPALVFLPSSVWVNRPKGFGMIVGTNMAMIEGLSLNSTIYGEAYANFGLLWPLALAIFLTICHFLYRTIAGRQRGVGFIAAFTAIALWRFDSSFIGVGILLTFFLVTVLRLISPRRVNRGSFAV